MCFKVMVCTKFLQCPRQGDITHGPSQLELPFLYPTPLPNALYKCFMKTAQRVLRSYGVHNNAFMDRQIARMDGWMDGFHADSHIP